MDSKLIEATEKVLEGFKAIIALTEQARLEQVSIYSPAPRARSVGIKRSAGWMPRLHHG
jgi:hypothetical protein